MRKLPSVLALLGLLAIACTGGANVGRSSATANPDSFDESPTAVIANAAILDPGGRVVGLANFRETRLGVRVEVKVTGLPAGVHGVHIHAAAKCDPPDFASAGPHFNINGGQHGIPGVPAAHAGDLPNIKVEANGAGSFLFYSPALSLNKAQSNGLVFGNGTSIVIHEKEDDQKTEPSGNSGARIACGIVRVPTG